MQVYGVDHDQPGALGTAGASGIPAAPALPLVTLHLVPELEQDPPAAREAATRARQSTRFTFVAR
jgi:hypothetical protein